MKRYIIIFLLLITSIMLVGCKGKTTIKESQLEEALKVFDNDNYQIKYTNKCQRLNGGTNIYNIVNYNKTICFSESNNNDSNRIYMEYVNGKIKAVFPSPFKDIYLKDYSYEVNDFFDDLLGELEDYSCYSWKEIIQAIIWLEFDTYILTFLSDDEVKSLLQKALKNSDLDADDINQIYQYINDGAFIYKDFNKLIYDKDYEYYFYSDSKCFIKYYFSKSKLVKLEYKDFGLDEEHILEISYNKEKVEFPKAYFIVNGNNYPKIKVGRGTERSLIDDILDIMGYDDTSNGDLKKQTFILSNDDFAEINTKTSTITFNLFTKETSAYVGFIVGDNLYMLKYYFD